MAGRLAAYLQQQQPKTNQEEHLSLIDHANTDAAMRSIEPRNHRMMMMTIFHDRRH